MTDDKVLHEFMKNHPKEDGIHCTWITNQRDILFVMVEMAERIMALEKTLSNSSQADILRVKAAIRILKYQD